MAFPAYSVSSPNVKDEETDKGADWLQCSSFIPEVTKIEENKIKESKARKKRKKVTKRSGIEELFVIDAAPIPQIKLSLPTPSEQVSIEKNAKRKKKKRKKVCGQKRYFTDELPILSGYEKMDPEEYVERTREFNILLRDQPHDVDSWCQYIAHQDKGEGTRSGIASKKLSIVDKALGLNTASEALLSLKLALMEELLPYDKVVTEAKVLASKHASSQVGWRWLISSTQFNLTRLTAPGLISHFGAMLEDSTKRGGRPKFILEVLLEVGLFLRQAGLWELLWTLIEQYLEICFTGIGSGAFKVSVAFPQKEIEKIEDGIMTSGLPLHALWVRTEHLRSSVHFLPTEEDTGDHQRLILPEDVAPLLYPIKPELSSRLSGVALTLLKVPPLPCTDAFVSYLGLSNIQWHLESSEILLTAKLPSGVSTDDDGYLNELKELIVPPQYIKDNLGSDSFLEAVGKLFELVAQHCQQDRINFLVWEIRWWHYLVKVKSITGPAAKPFSIKAKAMLKKERTSLPIYVEYALLEESLGNVDTSLKVFETAIGLQEPGLLANKRDKRDIFALYRAYAEVLLRAQPPDYKEKFFRLMIAMSHGEKPENVHEAPPELILRAIERFEHVTFELFVDRVSEEPPAMEDVVLGSSDLHWLSCHGWLNLIHRGKLPQYLEDFQVNKKWPLLSEGLTQLRIDIMGQMLKAGSASFDHQKYLTLIAEACSQYPNNTSLLHRLSSIKCDGLKWSKISNSLVETGSQVAVMFIMLLSKKRLFPEDTKNVGAVTKMYSILTKCAESKQLQRCPMLWRLVLQYVSCTHEDKVVEREYHKALEKCPWVKILYYEAVNQLPKLLADVQDLLIEKELRIHVTPEELEILREGAPGGVDESETGEVGLIGDKEENRKLEESAVEESLDLAEDIEPNGAITRVENDVQKGTDHTKSPESSNLSDNDNSFDAHSEDRTSESGSTDTDSDADNFADWSDEKKQAARRAWEAKLSTKRKIGDEESYLTNEDDTKKPRADNEMTRLEEVQLSNMVQDTCQDDDTTTNYDNTPWNQDKLKAIREMWDSKRNK